jgi:integrase/recombinase XerD
MSVTIAISLDIRRLKRKTSKFPVKLVVTYERNPQRYQTIYDLTQEEYDSLSASRVSEKCKKFGIA